MSSIKISNAHTTDSLKKKFDINGASAYQTEKNVWLIYKNSKNNPKKGLAGWCITSVNQFVLNSKGFTTFSYYYSKEDAIKALNRAFEIGTIK